MNASAAQVLLTTWLWGIVPALALYGALIWNAGRLGLRPGGQPITLRAAAVNVGLAALFWPIAVPWHTGNALAIFAVELRRALDEESDRDDDPDSKET